jgi:hypothetical protein
MTIAKIISDAKFPLKSGRLNNPQVGPSCIITLVGLVECIKLTALPYDGPSGFSSLLDKC